jgi:hypothetical protein
VTIPRFERTIADRFRVEEIDTGKRSWTKELKAGSVLRRYYGILG